MLNSITFYTFGTIGYSLITAIGYRRDKHSPTLHLVPCDLKSVRLRAAYGPVKQVEEMLMKSYNRCIVRSK